VLAQRRRCHSGPIPIAALVDVRALREQLTHSLEFSRHGCLYELHRP